MATKNQINLDNFFDGAEQVHQLSQAEAEIIRLKEEIETLRATGAKELESELEHLRQELSTQTGILEIALDAINPNPEQPRQTFLEESVKSMAHSLQREGQLQPVVLIEQNQEYLLFDGERRWRGAKELGWNSLKAVVIPLPEVLHRQSLLTSLHREDLNPLDKASAIVLEITQTTSLEPSDIPRLLSAVIRRLTKQGKLKILSEVVVAGDQTQEEALLSLELSEQEQALLITLLALQLNPASVDANILPMLDLTTDLKTAMREQGLKGSQAMLINQLSAKNLSISSKKAQKIRQETITQVLEEQLSVKATRNLVKEILKKYRGIEKESESLKIANSATKGIQKLSSPLLQKLETNQLEELRTMLTTKLSEISQVLEKRV